MRQLSSKVQMKWIKAVIDNSTAFNNEKIHSVVGHKL